MPDGRGGLLRKRKPRVLVVSHEASRTGAPRIAVEIVSAIQERDWDRYVVLRWPGPLQSDFASTGAKVVLEPLRRLRGLRRWRLGRPLVNYFEQLLAAALILYLRPDVIWCNTVQSACYVRPGIRLRRGVIVHALEPPERIAHVLGRYRLSRYWPSTLLVGCAPQACADLASVTSRPLGDIVNLPFVPNPKRVTALANQPVPELPAHGILVGACGTADLRKGVDLWLEMVAQVAPAVMELDPHFVWIGGDVPMAFNEWASRTSLGSRVTFTGSLDNPYPLLAALDVFTLTSRADPFPLVVFEAMMLQRPIVSFTVGDVPAQLGDAGRLVPPLAAAVAAEAVIALIRDPQERARLGEAAAARVRDQFPFDNFTRIVQKVTCDASRRVVDHSG